MKKTYYFNKYCNHCGKLFRYPVIAYDKDDAEEKLENAEYRKVDFKCLECKEGLPLEVIKKNQRIKELKEWEEAIKIELPEISSNDEEQKQQAQIMRMDVFKKLKLGTPYYEDKLYQSVRSLDIVPSLRFENVDLSGLEYPNAQAILRSYIIEVFHNFLISTTDADFWIATQHQKEVRDLFENMEIKGKKILDNIADILEKKILSSPQLALAVGKIETFNSDVMMEVISNRVKKDFRLEKSGIILRN